MDSPLTPTTRIVPNEVDKEALNVETNLGPTRIVLRSDRGRSVQPTESQGGSQARGHHRGGSAGNRCSAGGMGYTHGTVSCDAGARNNPYNTLESMRQKTMAQFALGEVLSAVDNVDRYPGS